MRKSKRDNPEKDGGVSRRSFLQTAGAGLALASSPLPVLALDSPAPPASPADYDESALVAPDGGVDGLQPKFVDVPAFGTRVRTRYYEAGQASSEPLVLIHGEGWSGHSSANVWSKNLPGLGQTFHVFAADKLGSGMTGNPPEDKDYNILGEVEHMYRFIQTMKLGKVHLAGQSRGGGCAFFLAYHHPEVVRTLVVVDSLTAAPGGASTREEMYAHCPKSPEGAEWRCRVKSLSFHPEAFSEAYFAAGMYMTGLPKAQETAAKLKGGLGAQAFGTPEKKDVLERVRTEGPMQMPTLLYWARNDPSAVLERGHAMYEIVAAKNPRARMLTTNKAGHFHFREYPEEWNFHVTRFIEYWRRQK
jgi:pimeloyl-ACP methyl ester carboxylesterase